jgi:hypothetical protein
MNAPETPFIVHHEKQWIQTKPVVEYPSYCGLPGTTDRSPMSALACYHQLSSELPKTRHFGNFTID